MRFTKTLLFFVSAPVAFADVTFTVPAPGGSYAAGTPITVTWGESNTPPLITALSSYDLALYSGSNASPTQLMTLVSTGTFVGNTVAVNISATVGGSAGADFPYFLGMRSTATAGGFVINYSSRFKLTGMTGVFPADVTAALATVSGATGPPTSNNVVAAAPPAGTTAAPGDTGVYAIPYNQQSGPIKYAPMQPFPPTSITATNTAPLWPTSSVVIATTFLPIPSVQTTVTQSGSSPSFASHANTASAASQPADDMQKFLNRWKD